MTGSRIACPAKGEPPRVAWAAQVTEACNAMMPVGGAPEMLVSEGPQGIGFRPIPQNLRNRGGSGSSLPAGCFEIAYDAARGDYSFANPYYMVGGVLKTADSLPTLSALAEVAGDEPSSTEVFICVKIQATTAGDEVRVVAYNGFEDLAGAQQDRRFIVVPIYKLSVVVRANSGNEIPGENSAQVERSWSVECDFRRGVPVPLWESIML